MVIHLSPTAATQTRWRLLGLSSVMTQSQLSLLSRWPPRSPAPHTHGMQATRQGCTGLPHRVRLADFILPRTLHRSLKGCLCPKVNTGNISKLLKEHIFSKKKNVEWYADCLDCISLWSPYRWRQHIALREVHATIFCQLMWNYCFKIKIKDS